MNTSPTVLSLEHVSKSFGSKQVLRDVSISVKKGEIFGFLGPNGAGKSTAIRLMLGVLYPTAGSISFFGDSDYINPKIHRRIGYLAGDMVLDDDLTGRQYLQFVASSYGKDCQKKRDELAKLLQADLDKKIGKYSRGSRQKIGLLAALMHEPELLILDEPTSGFDPLIQEQFIELMQQYRNNGGTVFVSSHILSEVQQICDRVAFIKDGSVVATVHVSELEAAATKSIRISAPAKVLQAITKNVSQVPGLTQRDGGRPDVLMLHYSGGATQLLQFLVNYDITDITIEEPELGEVFMGYYENKEPTQ